MRPRRFPTRSSATRNEVNRLYGVLDTQLARTGAFVAGADYSIADMAIFPWVRTHKAQQVDAGRLSRTSSAGTTQLFAAPGACKRGLTLGKELRARTLDDEARQALFGQTAQTRARRRRDALNPADHEGTPMIEFFFDCSSPWTYLAFHNIQPLAAEIERADPLAADPGRRRVQHASTPASTPRARTRCRPSAPTCSRTCRTGRVRPG